MPLLAVFFAISGFCSLVYQVAWLRIVMADFGVTSTMTAIVLSVFMAGLSLGSWGGGRVTVVLQSGTPASLLRLYGTAEALIGLSGVVSAPLLHFGKRALLSSSGMEWGSNIYYIASGGVVLLSLLPFCVCMGATFPLAMAAVRGAFPTNSATSFSYLYLANLLGAVIGCSATAFALIELIGFRGTMLAAAGLNMIVALTAFYLSSRLPRQASDAAGNGAYMGEAVAAPRADRRLYTVLMLTGMTSMALEVIWVRQFTLFLGPVVYTFATILSLFLLANCSGSMFYRRQRSRPLLKDNSRLLALLAAIAGFTALLSMLFADYRLPVAPDISGGVFRVAGGVVPFGLTIGFMTSWVIDTISGGLPDRAGKAYAINAVGCILGPLLAGFAFLPAIGERWSVLLLALMLLLTVPMLLTAETGESPPAPVSPFLLRGAIGVVSVAGLLLVFLTRGYESRYPGSLVMRDHTATVIAAGSGWDRQLLVNGYGMTELSPITKLLVHLPMAMHAAPPNNGLVLCFGMGTSFRSMLSWGIPSTVVELVPSIPGLFGYFHHDAAMVLADPNARVVVDDARRYLGRTTEKYDVIIVDPPPPFEAAASSLLYSKEFYREIVNRLALNGVFLQWTDLNDRYVLSSVTRALTAVFPNVRAYNSWGGKGMLFIASLNPLPNRSPAELAAVLSPRAAADLIEWGPFSSPVEQFADVLSREHDVGRLASAAPAARAIEDDRPVNEYFFLKRYLNWKSHE